MAEDNARPAEESGALDVERKLDRSGRARDQRGALRVKDRSEEGRLPTPPPDPQCPTIPRDQSGVTSRGPDDEEEDLVTYLSELGTSPFDARTFDYDTTPNSTTSAMGVDTAPFTEETFEHLDRLCALTEQILELRDRSSRMFRRVRGLERMKVQRNADWWLEVALANDEDLLNDFAEEDTGFAESLLDAMLSNCRDAGSAPRRSERSSVRLPRQRSRSLALTEQNFGSSLIERVSEADKRIASRNGGPKISKWTRVKAAFKWERACTNDLADIAESSPSVTSPTSATKYLKIPDTIGTSHGSWSAGSAMSPCTSEISSPSTPIGRVSPASSSNDDVFDDSRRNIVNYADRQLPPAKDEKKKDDSDRCGRSFDHDAIVEGADSTESPNEASRGKPLIRIISDADTPTSTANKGARDPEVSSKRPTPTLTISIPSNEEEIRNFSSPESTSPLPSSAQDSGGSSPQRPKPRQDIPSLKEFKRQYSTIEEAVTLEPKTQRQDSKWNKVRRAFLTNATFSVPPSPVRTIAAQPFANDDTRRARSCSESVEDLGKTVAGTNSNNNNNNNGNRVEARRDYQALREKFGAEFHRKLIEWERLKSARNTQDGPPLNEERLAPEFKKKLQDWKRAKKGRRSNAIEQQRVSRRRLTDWQLWRSSSSKPESRLYGKNQNSIGSRGSCASIGSAGSFGSDGKQHPCEDFIKKMEAWRRMNETVCRSSEGSKSPPNRVASYIDETEFVALEKLLLLFGQKTKRERRESDEKQLNDCFDGDSRLPASRGVSCGNEVLIRTSVGSYRFEGISREFTRKLYDWEKYRGISPRSSTFRLLGPGYTPFAQNSGEITLAESSNGKSRAFHWSLKRSKSDGSVFEGGSLRDEQFALRRSTSLQSLCSTDKLEDDAPINVSPAADNSQRIKDTAGEMMVEDSEPEAMIVDIEDVIEETASPLAGVQPHQTPVYSVAASETTSIAVPLGTVTSSHEPSPVFLVDAEDEDCERWNDGTWTEHPGARSNGNSPSPERSPVPEDGRTTSSLDEDKSHWTKNRDTWEESGDEANRDSIGFELLAPIYESKTNVKKKDYDDETGTANLVENSGATSTSWNAEELMDSPRTCEGMNETRKIEKLANEPNVEQTSDVENLRDEEDDGKVEERKVILSGDSSTRKSTITLSSSDRRDSGEISPKLSSLDIVGNNKDTSEYRGADIESETSAHCSSPELQNDVDRHYEILTFKTDACDNTIDNRLYEPVNCHEIHNPHNDHDNYPKGSVPFARLSETERPMFFQTSRSLSDSTVRTTPITVSGNDEARSVEKILINKETLKKIIVPTTNSESGPKSAEGTGDCLAGESRSGEGNDDRSNDSDRVSAKPARDNQGACALKKDGSSTKNVFVKTKRMIFGPFRKLDDRQSSRKESDGSVEGQPVRSSKSKSKSRSASPKLCRQDALLRVSLSLPWPLRSAARESDSPPETESRRSSGSKAEDTVTTSEKNSPCDESKANNKKFRDQLITGEESSSVENAKENIRIKSHSDKIFATAPINAIPTTSARVTEQRNRPRATSNRDTSRPRNDGELGRRTTKNNQVHFEVKQERKFSYTESESYTEVYAEQEEIKCGQMRDESPSKSDAVSSDLMHKLRILSDAAARREGRVTTSAEMFAINSPESRSSRIRRAKESFLSRRGGPFCRSMMEPTEVREDPWRRARISTSAETSKADETENARSRAEAARTARDEIDASSSEDKVDSPRDKDRADVDVRLDSLVKSASAGMINVDPDTFDRLVAADRGCESLPRIIAKRRDSSGPLAKIVSKLNFSRLIRSRNVDGGNMSTISTLCRQSLMIDTRKSLEEQPDDEREAASNSEPVRSKNNKDNNNRSGESSRTIRE